MSIVNMIKMGVRAVTLWRRGKLTYQESEILKEKIEKAQNLAGEMYEKAGRPDAAQVGGALGKKAGKAFLSLKKFKEKLDNTDL
ncbi:MAG: hypothetical protein ACOX2U_09450 [Limisphaerales bacterium]|jgi:hypothetical protein|nr:hypothetical protein [Verrucomicrobiota bacterium]